MKTKSSEHLQRMALAVVLLCLGMSGGEVYAQKIGTTCDDSSDTSCVVNEMQMISPDLLLIPLPCTEVSGLDCVPQLKIVDLESSNKTLRAASLLKEDSSKEAVMSCNLGSTIPSLKIMIDNIDDQLLIYLNGFEVYHRTTSTPNDELDLTPLLVCGRNVLTLVGANVSGPSRFFVDVLIGDVLVARYRDDRSSVTAIWFSKSLQIEL